MNKLVLVSLALLAACESTPPHDDMAASADASVADMQLRLADLAPPFDIAPSPIVAPAGKWTWIDVEDTTCNEGTPTGMGVNPGTEPDKLLVFFNGGGACGDYDSCYQLKTASLGPYTSAQFANDAASFSGWIVDRSLPGNPFATWTYVFIPYCTGDLHGGIQTNQYTSDDGKSTQTFHHMGHINALRDFDRLTATWPTLSTLVVSGSSAGGYGSIINYDDARKHWPSAKSYLIDDSGPPLERNVTPPNLTSWIQSWGMLDWALGVCPGCGNDLSQIVPTVSSLYPNDRMALLESLQDGVISMYYFLSGSDFQQSLQALAMDRIAPTKNFKYFFISGDTHTMLSDPSDYSSGSTSLLTFIDQEVSGNPAWTSLSP